MTAGGVSATAQLPASPGLDPGVHVFVAEMAMSPAFERRLARIDKALDRIRGAREAEDARLGLAGFYLKLAIVDHVMQTHGPEAAEWVLS